MFKTFAILSLSALALSGCVQPNGTASCAGVGAISGVALGALTDNNLAQSALAGLLHFHARATGPSRAFRGESYV